METQTIAARNVVDLALNDEFGSSICGQRISSWAHSDNNDTSNGPSSNKAESDKDYVYGWDC
jgi:prenylcysteine oxidase / farnesylcysteine lyase